MGALSLLRAMRSAAAGSVPRSPNLSCDPFLKRRELLHPRNTGAPLPAAPITSAHPVGIFATDSEQQVGGFIDVEIEFDTPGGPMKFKAAGPGWA
jgi:hypothetical protein